MGYAARANTTPRDGRRPMRLPQLATSRPQALLVFAPTRTPALNEDGRPVLGPNNKPLVTYGFTADAQPGHALSDTHYFDGRSIRRRR